MQHHIETLVKHFFHKESLQEVTVNQLQQFIDDYPYSAVGQLLLAKKLHDTGAQNFEEQGGKTTLYFHDPVWANWLLKQSNTAETLDFDRQETVSETPHFVFNKLATEGLSQASGDIPPPWEETSAPAPGEREEPVIDQAVAREEPPAVEHVQEQAPTPPPETQNPKPETETDLGFEPYHTIDYFASLGIKLKPEELAKDKLGQQLKSFTDWLRSMKKINPAQQGNESVAELDEITSKSIQRIAEFSNDAREIITEAMAEVWAKQGHREKAMAIYEKLSLLNPAKSSYFAARIEALKS